MRGKTSHLMNLHVKRPRITVKWQKKTNFLCEYIRAKLAIKWPHLTIIYSRKWTYSEKDYIQQGLWQAFRFKISKFEMQFDFYVFESNDLNPPKHRYQFVVQQLEKYLRGKCDSFESSAVIYQSINAALSFFRDLSIRISIWNFSKNFRTVSSCLRLDALFSFKYMS